MTVPLRSREGLTGTCALREGGVAASGGGVSVQGRERSHRMMSSMGPGKCVC
jgi:hypothetical protein